MARPIARDAEDFARLMLRTLERHGPHGEWLAGRALFAEVAARHPQHAFLGHLAAKPARRSTLNATFERLRAAEFPLIERRKDDGRHNGPVLYRASRAPAADPQPYVSLDLQLPYETPASHPLRTDQPLSTRRAALTQRQPNSPWRRRLLARRLPLPAGDLVQALATLRAFWHRLRATACGLATKASGR